MGENERMTIERAKYMFRGANMHTPFDIDIIVVPLSNDVNDPYLVDRIKRGRPLPLGTKVIQPPLIEYTADPSCAYRTWHHYGEYCEHCEGTA